MSTKEKAAAPEGFRPIEVTVPVDKTWKPIEIPTPAPPTEAAPVAATPEPTTGKKEN